MTQCLPARVRMGHKSKMSHCFSAVLQSSTSSQGMWMHQITLFNGSLRILLQIFTNSPQYRIKVDEKPKVLVDFYYNWVNFGPMAAIAGTVNISFSLAALKCKIKFYFPHKLS